MEILTNLHKKILTIFPQVIDADSFYFTGGTALSAFFLKHRRSEDLDFFTSVSELISPFSLGLETALRKENLNVEKKREFASFTEFYITSSDESTIIHLSLDSPFRLDSTIVSNEFPHLKIDSLKDMSANKLLALFGRASCKDFIDIFFILKEYFTKNELIELARRKDPGFDLYWLGVALERINSFEDNAPEMHLLISHCTIQELKKFFSDWRSGIIKEIKEDT